MHDTRSCRLSEYVEMFQVLLNCIYWLIHIVHTILEARKYQSAISQNWINIQKHRGPKFGFRSRSPKIHNCWFSRKTVSAKGGSNSHTHMWPGLRKGPLRVIVIRITLSGRPAMFFFMFWAISTVNDIILLIKTHFSYFGATQDQQKPSLT